MNTESAVAFPTPTRIHLGLAVADIPRAVRFYGALLGQAPSKLRDDYAKFETFDPPVNLSLHHTATATMTAMPQHFGIQVQRTAVIDEITERLATAGFTGEAEDGVTCCYAVQNKVWVTDPDGHRWEVYIVTQADAPMDSIGEAGTSQDEAIVPDAPCCAPTCCK